MNHLRYIFLCFLILATACNKKEKDDDKVWYSDSTIVLSDDDYANDQSDAFQIQDATIEGDSLKVMLRYGGGCGEVEAVLLASGSVMESFPVQRSIKITFTDRDYCKAIVNKMFMFDLKPVRVQGNKQVVLHLEDWSGQLMYQY